LLAFKIGIILRLLSLRLLRYWNECVFIFNFH